jgi:ATP-dependent protease HslVU (ClpYQ) ATPase subunit
MKGALSITALAIIAKINATQLKNSEELGNQKLGNRDYLGVRFIDEIDFDLDNVDSRV